MALCYAIRFDLSPFKLFYVGVKSKSPYSSFVYSKSGCEQPFGIVKNCVLRLLSGAFRLRLSLFNEAKKPQDMVIITK